MDATEYELRKRINELEEKVEKLEEELMGDSLREFIRKLMNEWNVIEPAAEDE